MSNETNQSYTWNLPLLSARRSTKGTGGLCSGGNDDEWQSWPEIMCGGVDFGGAEADRSSTARRLFPINEKGEEREMEQIVDCLRKRIHRGIVRKNKVRGERTSKEERETKRRMKRLDKAVDHALKDGSMYPLVRKVLRADDDLRGGADVKEIKLAPEMSQELTDTIETYLFDSDDDSVNANVEG